MARNISAHSASQTSVNIKREMADMNYELKMFAPHYSYSLLHFHISPGIVLCGLCVTALSAFTSQATSIDVARLLKNL